MARHKLTIRQKNDLPSLRSCEILLDGRPLHSVTAIELSCDAAEVNKATIHTQVDLDVQVNIDELAVVLDQRPRATGRDYPEPLGPGGTAGSDWRDDSHLSTPKIKLR